MGGIESLNLILHIMTILQMTAVFFPFILDFEHS